MRFSKDEIRQHLKALQLPPDGISYVLSALDSPPERRVGNGSFLNSVVRYASNLMNHVVQAESHTGEAAELIECEYDRDNVLAIIDQPKRKISIQGVRADGRRLSTTYTCDYLQIRRNGVFAVEVKGDKELRSLVRRRPHDWCFSKGVYHYLPAERVFARLGITHIVKPISSYNPIRIENLRLLIQARNAPELKTQARLSKRVKQHLKNTGACSLADLAVAIGILDLTPILRLIASKEISVNLVKSRLSIPDAAWVANSPRDLSVIEKLNEEFLPNSSRTRSISKQRVATQKKAISAANNLERLQKGVVEGTSARTLRRFKKMLRESGGDPDALGFDYWDKERDKSGLDPRHDAFIRRVIKKHYETVVTLGPAAVYKQYELLFPKSKIAREGQKRVVFNTFKRRILWYNQTRMAEKRGGKRLSYKAAPPVNPLKASFRAARPFQVGHIDHYLCDLWVIVAKTPKKTYIARPVLTLLRDEFSGEILGMAFGLKPPSRVACASVLRDCVRRHGRLPEWIMVDQGSEFRSTYFESVLAKMRITKQERPSGAPRWGGSLERTFGITKQELYGTLRGNSVNKKFIREVSPSHRPQNTADLSLFDAYRKTESYLFGHYNKHPRGKATKAPEVLRKEGLSRYSCSGVIIKYDLEFLMKTAIPADSKSYPIDSARGVRINDRYYKCPKLFSCRAARVEEPRLEIWDDNIAYLPMDGRWYVANVHAARSQNPDNPILTMCDSIVRRDGSEVFSKLKLERDTELATLTSRNHEVRERIKDADKNGAGTHKSTTPPNTKRRRKLHKPLTPIPIKFREVA